MAIMDNLQKISDTIWGLPVGCHYRNLLWFQRHIAAAALAVDAY
jgi:hypothetical protein